MVPDEAGDVDIALPQGAVEGGHGVLFFLFFRQAWMNLWE